MQFCFRHLLSLPRLGQGFFSRCWLLPKGNKEQHHVYMYVLYKHCTTRIVGTLTFRSIVEQSHGTGFQMRTAATTTTDVVVFVRFLEYELKELGSWDVH